MIDRKITSIQNINAQMVFLRNEILPTSYIHMHNKCSSRMFNKKVNSLNKIQTI